MKKHTEGPWRRVDMRIYANPDNYAVAEVMDYPKHSQGNADLIAAAPDMYDALMEIIAATGYCKPEELAETVFKIADEATLKARGEDYAG